ncbi:hypothetical protein AVEN_218152-1 [Araneus ventricosus]|uniref:Uncharacterized protein n=1 Tax=Araneus ventricosus TaxID=182803 RepID=A0A4Y2FRZ9_ARAVE|nr:hypothetical protein AVEN_218152-1 [Araneus ventricosus]
MSRQTKESTAVNHPKEVWPPNPERMSHTTFLAIIFISLTLSGLSMTLSSERTPLSEKAPFAKRTRSQGGTNLQGPSTLPGGPPVTYLGDRARNWPRFVE